jgi:hypothetical protein
VVVAAVLAAAVAAGPVHATNLLLVTSSDPKVAWEGGPFEPQRLGTRSTPRTVRITNHDVLPLEMGPVSLEPASSSYDPQAAEGVHAFSVVTDCPGAVLLEGASCDVQVTFAPLRPGTSSAALRIAHDGASREVLMGLGGTGTMGLFMAGAFGEVLTFGSARSQGDLSHVGIDTPVLGMAITPSGQGYWLVQAGGEVHPFGDAPALGHPQLLPERFVVGMAATPSGGGYWFATDEGSVYAFGDAVHHGSAADVARGDDFVIGITATPSGGGYWLLDTAGGVYAFGDAGFQGAPASLPPRYPVTAMASTPTGQGYWVIDALGGIFAYGDATGLPSEKTSPYAGTYNGEPNPYVAVEAAPYGQGIWYTTLRGGIRSQGDAQSAIPTDSYYSDLSEAGAVDLAVDVRPFTPAPEAGTVQVVPGRDGLRPSPSLCALGACEPPDEAPVPPPLPALPPAPVAFPRGSLFGV